MRIAITGASGFIGSALLQGLRNRGYETVGLARRGPDIHWDIAAGPLAHPPAVDAVVHCAALVRDGRMGAPYRAVNVMGTEHVLDTFPRARIVHLSSSSVYDPWRPKVRVREDAAPPAHWLNGYGETKWAAEGVVARLRPDAVILRPHAVYGPGDTTLVPRILRARIAGRQLAIGDGTNRITLTAITNLVDAVAVVLEQPTAVGVFNLGDPDTPTMAEVLHHLLRTLDLPPATVWMPRPLAWRLAVAAERLAGEREPLLSRYAVNSMALESTLDLSRAKRDLGWVGRETYRDFALGDRHSTEVRHQQRRGSGM